MEPEPYSIDINKIHNLKFVNEEKVLGVTVDLKLKFSSHNPTK